MGTKKTHEQFVDEVNRKYSSVQVLGHYTKSNEKVKCRCLVCGNEWDIRPNNLLHGYGCPECALKRRVKARTKTLDDFKNELNCINPNIRIKGPYNGARTPLKCKCLKCGHEWNAAPTNLLKGRGCPECAKRIRAEKNRRSHDEFTEIVHKKHPFIVFLEPFTGNNKQIKAKCMLCGYEWTTLASSLVYGHGCPRCAKNGVYSHEEFIEKLKTINPYVLPLSEYNRAAKPIKCECLRCGNTWMSKPNNLLSGKGCPSCYHSTTSFIEQVILLSLRAMLPNCVVLHRDRKAIGKELDIFIPAMKLAIEPGSWRWHRDKLENDAEKRLLCKQQGIRLITIYSDFDGGEKPFSEDCIVLKETLAFEKDNTVLKSLIEQIFSLCDIVGNLTEKEWISIINESYDKSRRITTTEFKKRVKRFNNSVEVIGEYTGAWNKIECRCSKCGYEWSPIANSIVRGSGCPRCAHYESGVKKRKDPELFKIELRMINPNIELTDRYVKSSQKVGCRCLICGYEWNALPSNLLKGKGCPVCRLPKEKKNN